jgi:hypothetical protein
MARRAGRAIARVSNITRLADDQVALTQVLEEAPDVVFELRGRAVDLQANLLDDLGLAALAVDEPPDHASKRIDAVVLPGVQVEEDAPLASGKLTEGHVRVLSRIRVVGDEGLQS